MARLFITMEGPDGSGKTTQIRLLSEYLQKKGYSVILTREPGGTSISEEIRNIILDVENEEMADITEAFLYASSRAQHVEQLIKPALEQGKIVICDRFVDSSVAYQGVARGLGIERVETINWYATGGLSPDITFFLDLEPTTGIRRKKNQAALDRLEKEALDFHKKVYQGYQLLKDKHSERMKVIQANQSIKEVHQQILKHINEML